MLNFETSDPDLLKFNTMLKFNTIWDWAWVWARVWTRGSGLGLGLDTQGLGFEVSVYIYNSMGFEIRLELGRVYKFG